MAQSITRMRHIDEDTELMKRSIQPAQTLSATKTERHENNNRLRDCHYCWRLTHSYCILERTMRLCQSNDGHWVSTYCTDGDLDWGRACQTQREERGEDEDPFVFSDLYTFDTCDTFPLCLPDSFPISLSARVYCC